MESTKESCNVFVPMEFEGHLEILRQVLFNEPENTSLFNPHDRPDS